MLTLDLFGGKGERDSVAAGRTLWSDDGSSCLPSSKADSKLWKNLLTEGASWELFEKILEDSKNYTFVEECLPELAEVLGMDGENITLEYEDFEEENPQVLELYFKPKGVKKLSLNAAFVKVFGEGLEPLGFKRVKGERPYFVRVINGEVLHMVSCHNEPTYDIHKKQFEIYAGIATVYSPHIDFKKFSEGDSGTKNTMSALRPLSSGGLLERSMGARRKGWSIL